MVPARFCTGNQTATRTDGLETDGETEGDRWTATDREGQTGDFKPGCTSTCTAPCLAPGHVLAHKNLGSAAVTPPPQHLDQESAGFVHEAASLDPYLGEANMCTVAFQRGFAERIGETHLNWGLKLRACSDALIVNTGYFLYRNDARQQLRAPNTGRRFAETHPLPSETKNFSSLELGSRHSLSCQGANTWQPFGIIKTGHTPQPPPPPRIHRTFLPPLPTLLGNCILCVAAASTSPANHTRSTICLEWR
ncbi:hypothetical protein Q5P01_025740 [Channa striata]|uniref:Uncharacterized protein n=1 Tax=Channa striata TaxID=64152 RepID=A0AA88J619_CHASR|nr:hypothetical protein Q5P01_025740 [Channa striata]